MVILYRFGLIYLLIEAFASLFLELYEIEYPFIKHLFLFDLYLTWKSH